ncbi:Succinylglutamate desuccinylase / Aspartoacylase family protein [Ferrimonas sediminum]|uniref:Succinylglutamate desuccinylase / Aspartoacylase family protein n=1 Tax=Ferrimonas sediminum TaxID=718193 RepID=A0A1G8SY19_9GAMM|nr:M14 family metallocarboxypeptidase [Ferrimonas sediminum]SDJ34127.1 Succinylglutamate desuccinylase / Aspartoacylase family protein [Ferrimonas sediminum]
MTDSRAYPIGRPHTPWSDADKAAWRARAQIQRSYQTEVVSAIRALANRFELLQYGALSYDTERYPLLALKSHDWQPHKPTVLISGGVHGYETSGVHGALAFAASRAQDYQARFNLIIAPCVSPWGYETINRWNPNAVDPNRSFYPDSPAQESASLMRLVDSLQIELLAHIDLHETTDTDELEFRPALAARDGIEYVKGTIPDGFYLVGDSDKPEPEFQSAMIAAVRQVTHIAPADSDGNIIGSPVQQTGVINYPTKKLGLCAGLSDAPFVTTTEVYPDSPTATAEQCNQAQVAAICGGLEYISNRNN